MRVRISDPSLAEELLGFLRRADCIADVGDIEAHAEGIAVVVEVPQPTTTIRPAWRSRSTSESEARIPAPASGADPLGRPSPPTRDRPKQFAPISTRCAASPPAALAALILAAAATATIEARPGHVRSRPRDDPDAGRGQARPSGRKSGTRWYYARVWVGFRGRRVVEVTTTRSTERLANGLGVDSTESEVRATFPQAQCAQAGAFRRCRLGTGARGSRVTDFTIGHGRVLQVTVQLLP